jgi:phosphate transport system permease protein
MSTLVLDATTDPILDRRRRVQEAAAASLRRRKLTSGVAIGVCWLALAIAVVPLVAVIVYVVVKGIGAWNYAFFFHSTTPEGVPGGGIWNSIVGTIVIGAIATVVTIPIGLACGLFLAQSEGRIGAAVRFSADVMTGMPSITIGIFGYIAVVSNTKHYSGLAGAFAIGIIMLPVIMRAAETALRGVPLPVSEAGFALGAHRSTIDRRVVIPTALPGILTGVLLAVARGLGETAPLLLTIFGNQYLQWNPTQPMDAIPLEIYNNSSQPYPDLVQLAWGGALLLVVVVLVLNVGARVTAAWLGRERS